jgi:hypothetical protein
MIELDWLKNASQYIFAVLVVGLVVFYLYEHISDNNGDVEQYTEFSKELHEDMARHGIAAKDQKQIEAIVDRMIDKKKKERSLKKVANACKNGIIRGCLVGFVSGGIPGAIASGATYGVVNGVMNGFFES